ncbi:MAG: heme-binding protein [Rhodomicrobiaceae bacterium]
MTELTLALANRLIEALFARAAEMGGKPLAAAVVGPEGNVISLQRQDKASMFRNEVASGKAWGAVAMGVTTREMLKRSQQNPVFFQGLGAASHGRILTSPGGVPILGDDGRVIGAVGVSGDVGDNDEAFALHAIAAVGLKAGA